MPYLGTPPQSGFITSDSEKITGQTTNYVNLSNAISSLDDVQVHVNYVIQDPSTLSLTSSTRIGLGDTLVSADVVLITYLGKSVATQSPPVGGVTNDMLAGSIANSKLANSSITLNGSAVSLGGSATIGGGKIGQVVQTAKTDTFSSTSTSDFDITGMSVAITPSASNSKILVFGTLNFTTSAYQQGTWISLVRDSTQIFRGDSAGSRRRAMFGFEDGGSNENEQQYRVTTSAFQFLDSPSTTSATTYKLTAINLSSSYTFYVNRTHSDGDNANYARVPSSITAMEVLV